MLSRSIIILSCIIHIGCTTTSLERVQIIENSRWKNTTIALAISSPKYSSPSKNLERYQDRIISDLKDRNFFANVSLVDSGGKPDFVLNFDNCHGDIDGHGLWETLNVGSGTLIPYWDERSRCLTVKDAKTAQVYQLRKDYKYYSHLFLAPWMLIKKTPHLFSGEYFDSFLIDDFLTELAK